MALKSWIRETVTKAMPVASKLVGEATELLEKRAPKVAERIRPMFARLEEPGTARTGEPPPDERARQPGESTRSTDAAAEPKTAVPLRSAGKKTVAARDAAPAPKRATAKKQKNSEAAGFKVKRGQKHHHHR